MNKCSILELLMFQPHLNIHLVHLYYLKVTEFEPLINVH